MRGLKRQSMQADAADESVESDVADECEAFLAGAYVDACHRLGLRAPVWTWLNEVAHADPDRLRAVASTIEPDHADIERRTRAALAQAVVAAMSDRGLTDLQRELLVPLELCLAGTELTPRRLVELVGRTLYL